MLCSKIYYGIYNFYKVANEHPFPSAPADGIMAPKKLWGLSPEMVVCQILKILSCKDTSD